MTSSQKSIYHIIYPFRSQVVSFFLADEQVENKDDRRFLLTAHLGLSIRVRGSTGLRGGGLPSLCSDR